MGYISKLTKEFPGQSRGRAAWDAVFGGTDKETGGSGNKPVGLNRDQLPGNTGLTSTPTAVKKLIQAFRSKAPGGWSDDRFLQTSKWTDVRYLVGHKLSEQMSMAELKVFVKDVNHPDGRRPVTADDPPHGPQRALLNIKPYDLVRVLEKPNWEDSWGDLLYNYTQQITLTGTWLLWQLPNAFGIPMELYTIPTAVAIPQPVVNPLYPHGYYRIQPLYPYGPFSSFPAPTTAVGAAIPAEWMMRVKYQHPFLRYEGWSPQTGLRLTFDQIEQMDKAQWYGMKRVIGADMVMNFADMEGMQPLNEAEIERIHAEWENEFMGAENYGKLIVGTPGAKLEPLSNNLKDLQFQEGWEQKIGFAMAGLGMSKEAAGMIGSAAYAVLYAAIKQLHLLTCLPMCCKVGWALTRQIAPHFGDDLIVEVTPKRIDDPEINKIIADTVAQNKAGTKNEVRKLMGLPITQEPWGEDIAGDPSEFEKEQIQQQQDAMQQQQMQGNPAQGGGEQNIKKPEEGGKEPGTEDAKPKPGETGRGSFGHDSKDRRKSLNGHANGRLKVLA